MSETQGQQAMLAEGLNYVDEIITVLGNEDIDIKDADRIVATMQDYKQRIQTREDKIKSEIDVYLKACEEEQASTEHELQDENLAKEVSKVKSQLKEIEENQNDVAQAVKKLKSQHDECGKERDELEKYKAQVEKETTKHLPSIRHDVNLYSHITGIRWQYDCEPHEVKGNIISAKKVKTFSLNSQKNSQFFIANYLWDQMEPDW